MSTRPDASGIVGPLVRCLSFHADYGCRNSGICCSSDWEVPVEQQVELSLRPRLIEASGRLPHGPDGFTAALNPPVGCASAFRRHDFTGSCWFRDQGAGLCAIHREFGEQALPSACRQFPRVCVVEPATVSVSLSHYCPTAAGLLFRQDTGLSLVESPPGFPTAWPFEGLDARSAYPPLLKPGVLLGFDGLRTFEQEAVRVLAEVALWRSLGRIEGAVAAFRGWAPARGRLTDHIRASFGAAPPTSASWCSADPTSTLIASVTTGARIDVRLPAFSEWAPEPPPGIDLALRRYLAARLIAAWIMFQAEDIDAVMRYLRLCLNTVLLFATDRSREAPAPDRWKEAIRSADLWILHYCDPELLARNLG